MVVDGKEICRKKTEEQEKEEIYDRVLSIQKEVGAIEINTTDGWINLKEEDTLSFDAREQKIWVGGDANKFVGIELQSWGLQGGKKGIALQYPKLI